MSKIVKYIIEKLARIEPNLCVVCISPYISFALVCAATYAGPLAIILLLLSEALVEERVYGW